MDAITRTLYTIMKRRVEQIYRNQVLHVEEIQERQWKRVMRCLQGSLYGLHHDVTLIKDIQSYQERIPLIPYESVRSYVERMKQGERNILLPGLCNRFAISSGTSGGRSKFIPVSALHLQMCHFKGASDVVWLYLSTRPDSRFFATKGLTLGGSQKPVSLSSTISQGDLSSILIEQMPRLGNLIRVPSKKTLLLEDWQVKIPAIIAETCHQPIGSISGVPSWMLTLIKNLLETKGVDNLSDVWPDLEVFFHGGISFTPYRKEYEHLIPSPRMQYRETYNASEGFFGIQDDPLDSSMMLMLDYGIFYEFIPLDELEKEYPKAIPLTEVAIWKTYAMVISTLGGLYRYIIGDTVQFTQRNPYKFIIVGRTTSYINAFGEELMVHHSDEAIARVARRMDVHVREYTAAPGFDAASGKGWHEWLVEFDTPPRDEAFFAQLLHEELKSLNSDYDAKSLPGMTLQPLRLKVATSGTFNRYLQRYGKLGGQNKIPRLRNDRDLLEKLYNCL